MVKTTDIAPGLLASAPSLRDPPFDRSLVLLARHDEDGALGLIINKPLDINLDALLSRMGMKVPASGAERPVLFGGPVSPDVGWLISGQPASHEDGHLFLTDGLYLSSNRVQLEKTLASSDDSPFYLCLGYAGWGPLQLDSELAQGAWIPCDLNLALVFEVPFERRWERALRGQGVDPGCVGSGPFLA